MPSVLHVPHYDVEKQAMIEPFSYLEMETSASNPRSDLSLWVDNVGPTLMLGTVSVSSGGDVYGPTSSTDNGIVRYKGLTGKLVQNSTITISDTGVLTFPASLVLFIGATQALKVDSAANVSIGKTAGDSLTSGVNNTLIGENAGTTLTTGNSNVFLGRNAGGTSGTTTSDAIAIGNGALAVTSSTNIAIGGNALSNGATTTIAIGNLAGSSISGLPTSCVLLGHSVGNRATGMLNNVVIGHSATNLFTGVLSSSTLIGHSVLSAANANAASKNTLIGAFLLPNTSGTVTDNVGLGTNILANASTGNVSSNTITGTESLNSISAHGGVNRNTLLGCRVMQAKGSNAATRVEDNIIIGHTAGSANTSSTADCINNIWVGSPGVSAESNTIRIGTGASQSKCFVAGVYAATEADSNFKFAKIGTSGQIVGGDLYSSLITPIISIVSYTLVPNTVASNTIIGVTLVKQGKVIQMHVPSWTLTGLTVDVNYYETPAGGIPAGYVPAASKTFVVPIFTRVLGGVDVDIMGRATLGLFGGEIRLRIEKEPVPGTGKFTGVNAGWDAFTMTYYTD